MEALGYVKDADWVEYKILVPDQLPEKHQRLSEMLLQRYRLKIKKLRSRKEIREGNYGQKIFDLINEAYAPLYGYSQMTQGQIDEYVKTYLNILDLQMVTLVENEQVE